MIDANQGLVFTVATCRMRVNDYRWPLVEERRTEIDQHWQQVSRENAALFDGQVLMVHEMRRHADALDLSLFATRFRDYLYWRHTGFADPNVIDGFGAGVIQSADGALMLARQRPGNINEGLFYFPGGFIDPRDVEADGAVDIATSVQREVEEETGLSAGELDIIEGFTVAQLPAQLAIAVTCRSRLDAVSLADRIRDHVASLADPEIDEVLAVRSAADVTGVSLASYCRLLLPRLLGAGILPQT